MVPHSCRLMHYSSRHVSLSVRVHTFTALRISVQARVKWHTRAGDGNKTEHGFSYFLAQADVKGHKGQSVRKAYILQSAAAVSSPKRNTLIERKDEINV